MRTPIASATRTALASITLQLLLGCSPDAPSVGPRPSKCAPRREATNLRTPIVLQLGDQVRTILGFTDDENRSLWALVGEHSLTFVELLPNAVETVARLDDLPYALAASIEPETGSVRVLSRSDQDASIDVYTLSARSVERSHSVPLEGYPLWAKVPGDFDGDGVDDFLLYAPCQESSGRCLRIVGVRDGALALGDLIEISAIAWGATSGDFDGDGSTDLVLVGPGASEVWLGDGRFGFRAGSPLPAFGMYSVATGDVDGDGDVDVVAAGPAGEDGVGAILLNDGGEFSVGATFPTIWPGDIGLAGLGPDVPTEIFIKGAPPSPYNGGWIHRLLFYDQTVSADEKLIRVSRWGGEFRLEDVDGDCLLDMVAADDLDTEVLFFRGERAEVLEEERMEACMRAPVLRRGRAVTIAPQNRSTLDPACSPYLVLPEAHVRVEGDGSPMTIMRNTGPNVVLSLVDSDSQCSMEGTLSLSETIHDCLKVQLQPTLARREEWLRPVELRAE